MTTAKAKVQKRNLLFAGFVSLAFIALAAITDSSLSDPSSFQLIGLVVGVLGYAIVDTQKIMHRIIQSRSLKGGVVLLPAIWYTPLGALFLGVFGGIAIGLLGRLVISFFSVIRMVGVRSPLAIMEVGGSDQVTAQLFYKPRFTTDRPTPVNGSITFTKSGSIYSLSNGGGAITKGATPSASELLTGVTLGQDVLQVSGSDTSAISFDAMTVNVHVVANQPDSITYYRLAISHAVDYWYNSPFGNILINTGARPPAGLCDEWMDWGADWLARVNKGDICKIEKCLSANGSHNYLRVTMCDERVFYFDPWMRPKDPVFGKDEYEKEYGNPSDVSTHWQR